MTISGLRVVTTARWVMAGMWLRNISRHIIHMSITEDKYGKSLYTGPVHLYRVYRSDYVIRYLVQQKGRSFHEMSKM